jgi:NADH-ubiquinone oxidoreductase chain 5
MLVLIFVFSIMFLIISPNVISILLGWDGLGLVPYLLVINYQNVEPCGARMLTVLSNRIGNVALLIVIAWIINFGSWRLFIIWIFYQVLLRYNWFLSLLFWLLWLKCSDSFFFLVACCNSSPYSCVCFGSFFYFGYRRCLFIDSV